MFAAAAQPDVHTALFLASWVQAHTQAGEASQDPDGTPAGADVGKGLLSIDHINSLLSAPSGVPPCLRSLSEKCVLQRFGDVFQVLVSPKLRASFCSLNYAAIKRWAMSDELVCTFGEHDVVFALCCWHSAQKASHPNFELASVVRVSQLSRGLRHALPFFASWWPAPELTAAFNAVSEAGGDPGSAQMSANVSATPPCAPPPAAAPPSSTSAAATPSSVPSAATLSEPAFPFPWSSLTARQSVSPATAAARAEATVVFTHQQLSDTLSTEPCSAPFYARGFYWALALELKDQQLWVSLEPSGPGNGSAAGSTPHPPAVRASFHISLQQPDGTLTATQACSAHPRWFLGGQGMGGAVLGAGMQGSRPIRSVHDFRHFLSPYGGKAKKGLVLRCTIDSAE